MSLRLKVGLLVGVLLITAFAFAENGGQIQPAATVAVSQPATAAALPETPMAAQKPAAAPAPKPPLGITYGISGRWRNDNLNNASDFTNAVNDESRFARVATSIFGTVNMGKYVDGSVTMTSEVYKRWYQTCNNATAICGKNGLAGKSISVPFTSADMWFDAANLMFKQLPIKNSTLQIGRFSIVRGDGFFLWTGQPGAGPKTNFFDAFDMAYTHGKHKVELIGTWNGRTDNFYPVINQVYNMTPTIGPGPVAPANNDLGDLSALIVYYTNRQLKSTDIDGYYAFNKQDNMYSVNYNNFSGYTAAGYSNIKWQPDRHWNSFGGRLVQRIPHDIIAHFNITGEIGTQVPMTQAGNNHLLPGVNAVTGINGYPQVDIRAWGMDAIVTKYFLKTKTKPYVGFLYAYFSGSDPKNPKTDGNYIGAFGEWGMTSYWGPFMENGYALASPFTDVDSNYYQQELGTSPMYLANTATYNARGGFTPWQGKVAQLQVEVQYHHVNAPHPFVGNAAHYNPNPVIPAGATSQQIAQIYLTPVIGTLNPFFNTTTLSGLHRNDEYELVVKFMATRQINMFAEYVRTIYGNFYAPSWKVAQYTGGPTVTAYPNGGQFVRLQLNYRFTGFRPFKKAPKA